ncbi:hypothetical protein L596_012020 [Steinernema carpocapsae]|uniref:Uncharacterized protein n=1 Tax=Steinernema carpocapsae TaxID=34508 RepID=A0A4U5NWM9_STECR|nr:hypothetical protein L596_012020 [Steinernema carpocapsae]
MRKLFTKQGLPMKESPEYRNYYTFEKESGEITHDFTVLLEDEFKMEFERCNLFEIDDAAKACDAIKIHPTI